MYFLHKNIVIFYISYEIDTLSRDLNTDFTQGNCLLGAVILIKNVDADKYKYSGCRVGFNLCSQFSWKDGSCGENVIFFGIDMSLFVHVDNKKEDILVIGEGPTQALDSTTITAEDKYPINFTESGKRFLLSLHYNGNNSFLFVNAVKMWQLKAKYSEINHILYV